MQVIFVYILYFVVCNFLGIIQLLLFNNKNMETFESANQEQEKTPQQTFRDACHARLDGLVEDGTFSIDFADERRKSADFVEDGISDPEEQGIAFAEIGMESVLEFKSKVAELLDSLRKKLDEKEALLESYADRIESMLGNSDVPESKLSEIRNHIENSRRALADAEQVINDIENGGIEALLKVDTSVADIETTLKKVEPSEEDIAQ